MSIVEAIVTDVHSFRVLLFIDIPIFCRNMDSLNPGTPTDREFPFSTDVIYAVKLKIRPAEGWGRWIEGAERDSVPPPRGKAGSYDGHPAPCWEWTLLLYA
jgi:hypothetical protein